MEVNRVSLINTVDDGINITLYFEIFSDDCIFQINRSLPSSETAIDEIKDIIYSEYVVKEEIIEDNMSITDVQFVGDII